MVTTERKSEELGILMKVQMCFPSLAASFAILLVMVSSSALADYGEGFIVFRCNQNAQFEMTRRYIWNEELEALLPLINSGRGIVKQNDTLLFNIRLLGVC